jgi:hypothetical protein
MVSAARSDPAEVGHMPQASRQALHGFEPRREHRQDHRAINVPLAPVTNGLSRRLADTQLRRSPSTEARIGQIPKLTVRHSFAPEARRPRDFLPGLFPLCQRQADDDP